MITRQMTRPCALASLLCSMIVSGLLGACAASASRGFEQMTVAERIEEAHRLASEASFQEDPIEAQALYLASLDAYPQFAASWNNLGVLLMEDGRMREANEAFETAAALDQRDPRPSFNRGLMHQRRGQLEQAVRAYDESLQRDPNYLPALMGHIECEIRRGEADSATIPRIERAITLHRDDTALEQLRLELIRLSNELGLNPNLPE